MLSKKLLLASFLFLVINSNRLMANSIDTIDASISLQRGAIHAETGLPNGSANITSEIELIDLVVIALGFAGIGGISSQNSSLKKIFT